MKSSQSVPIIIFSTVIIFTVSISLGLLMDLIYPFNKYYNVFGIEYFGQWFIVFPALFIIYPCLNNILLNIYFSISGRKLWNSWLKFGVEYAYLINLFSIIPVIAFIFEISYFFIYTKIVFPTVIREIVFVFILVVIYILYNLIYVKLYTTDDYRKYT